MKIKEIGSNSLLAFHASARERRSLEGSVGPNQDGNEYVKAETSY